jgi:geranylgeranyl reductase family protein
LTEVIIVGGSITGGIAARESARKGFKTTIIEEHGFVGKQGKCTALVSINGLKKIGVDYEKAFMNDIYGAVIHSKHFSFKVEKRTPMAVVLDRQKLDEEVVNESVDDGADLKLRTRLEGIENNKIKTNRQTLSFDYLVGADGFSSTTATLERFPEIKKKVLCYEAEFEGKNEGKLVDVYLDSEAFPGFFEWVVPAGTETKTGFGTTKINEINAIKKKFLQRAEIKKFEKMKKEFYAFIPMEERKKIQKRNVLLVGDAAGQAKPTTGGGIVFGGLGAITAIEKLKDYEEEWKKQKTLKKHLLIRKFLDRLGNNILDAGVLSAGAGFNKILEWAGDMDLILK